MREVKYEKIYSVYMRVALFNSQEYSTQICLQMQFHCVHSHTNSLYLYGNLHRESQGVFVFLETQSQDSLDHVATRQ